MKLLRTAFGGLLFLFYSIRTFDLEFFFMESGLIPREQVIATMVTNYRYSVLDYFPGEVAVWCFHLLFLASLLAMTLGYRTRVATLIAFVLHISFLHRNMAAVFGIDLIACFFLLYLAMAEWAALASVAYRLSQIQVCIIYFYSGTEKVRGPSWWRGEALWEVLANAQIARFDFSWLAQFPWVIVTATYATLLWELYFPVLVWMRKGRLPCLILGALIHAGIAFTVNLPFFGASMVFTYAVFLSKRETELISAFPQKIFSTGPNVSQPCVEEYYV